jgi:predicted AlkP superfamily phosphohydrolase/phosphomutase
MVARTLFIGLDGATFQVLDPLMAKGVMPFLKGFVENAARAPLRSIIPPLTPPAWTTIMTGKRPGQHGVFDFFQKETPESLYFHFTGSLDIQSATIWSLASLEGKRVISLNFPQMFPPPAVNGSVVPGGWMPWRQLRLGCHPAGLFDRLKELPSFNARELAMDMTLEAKAIEGCAEEEYADWIALHVRREQRWFDIMRFLMTEDEPSDLVCVMFDGVDKLQHLCWRFLDPDCWPENPTPWEQETRRLCEDYFRQLDEHIAGLVELAGPGASVILASDHGFGPTSDIFYVNTWLEQQGYLAWSESADAAEAGNLQVGFGQIARHVYQLDWDRTVAYAATPSSQGIYIVSQRPNGQTTMTPDEYDRLCQEIIDGLGRLKHPVTGEPLLEKAWTRREVFSGPFEALGTDLTLTLSGGTAMSILRTDRVFDRRPVPQGNHRWDGIFVAQGPDIQSGSVDDELSILDVAPLILYSLDLPIPTDVAGQVPEEILLPDQLQRRPPRSIDASTLPETSTAEPAPTDPEAEEAILARLRALGYVE